MAGIEHDARTRFRAVQPGPWKERDQPAQTDDRSDGEGTGECYAERPWAISGWAHDNSILFARGYRHPREHKRL
jgi:hypothetical protein